MKWTEQHCCSRIDFQVALPVPCGSFSQYLNASQPSERWHGIALSSAWDVWVEDVGDCKWQDAFFFFALKATKTVSKDTIGVNSSNTTVLNHFIHTRKHLIWWIIQCRTLYFNIYVHIINGLLWEENEPRRWGWWREKYPTVRLSQRFLQRSLFCISPSKVQTAGYDHTHSTCHSSGPFFWFPALVADNLPF